MTWKILVINIMWNTGNRTLVFRFWEMVITLGAVGAGTNTIAFGILKIG